MNLKVDLIGIASSSLVAFASLSIDHISDLLTLFSQGIGVIASALSVLLTIQLVKKNRIEIKERLKRLKNDELDDNERER